MGYLPWSYILSPYRFPGHKIFGVLYLIGEIATLYGMFVKREAFESQPLWFLSMYLAGVLTTNGAIRNFRHLAKTNVNPGMFAKDRTFSMGFIVENLWFQVALLIKMVFLNPNWWGAAGLIKVPLQVFILGFDMYWTAIRKAVFPVTSYTTWEQGNDKLNDGKVSEKQINWINVQVRAPEYECEPETEQIGARVPELERAGERERLAVSHRTGDRHAVELCAEVQMRDPILPLCEPGWARATRVALGCVLYGV
jgi:hypothetical protein